MLIRGASGSGKSALALALLALGAGLIADDQVTLTRRGQAVIAGCPPALRGMIEARGIGILRTVPAAPTPLAAILDLDRTETDRLPPWRHVTVLGCSIPLIYRPRGVGWEPALLQYLRAGRIA